MIEKSFNISFVNLLPSWWGQIGLYVRMIFLPDYWVMPSIEDKHKNWRRDKVCGICNTSMKVNEWAQFLRSFWVVPDRNGPEPRKNSSLANRSGHWSFEYRHTVSEPSVRFNSMNQHFWAQNIEIYHKNNNKSTTLSNHLATTTIVTS